MPSRRSSRSPASGDRSRSPERRHKLPDGASPISESDYFQKSDEFRAWLKEDKGKYFDELSGDKARSYFRKFVKAWNKGKLQETLYSGIDLSSQAASAQTAFQWSFAKNRSRVDADSLRAAREQVGAATNNRSLHSPTRSARSSGRVHGPTLPSSSDLVMAREAASEHELTEKAYQRKRQRAEANERLEDSLGPKAVGKEALLEKKRVKRESDRVFRDKGDEGLEADEGTLMGGGEGFRDAIARRDAARRRFEEKRGSTREDKLATSHERVHAIRERDKATMSMFQQMAKERFG